MSILTFSALQRLIKLGTNAYAEAHGSQKRGNISHIFENHGIVKVATESIIAPKVAPTAIAAS